MKKNILIILLIFILTCSNCFAKSKTDKLKRGADIYFKVTQTLELSLNQQRKLFGVKLDETYNLAPLIEEIKNMEQMLENGSITREEEKNLRQELNIKKALASQKKRYYISRYRSILTEEQNHKLDELIFDIANGYLKL